jgi:hypothetical protein
MAVPDEQRPGYRASANAGTPSVTLEDLLSRYDNSWQMQGGYDNRGAVNKKYDDTKANVTKNKNEADTKLTNLYGQLGDLYKAIPEQTRQRYLDSINAGQAGSEGLNRETRNRIDMEAAQRAAAYASMGVGGSGESTAAQGQMERGVGDVNAAQANWAGLMGGQQNAEMNRNQLDITGAADQGTMVRGDLATRYNDYLNQLEQQRQGELAGAVGGGSMVNTSGISGGLYEKLQQQFLQKQGILPTPTSGLDEKKAFWDYQVKNPKAPVSTSRSNGNAPLTFN